MRPLDGKVALITGGSSGIGRETALGLARRGARVVLAARDPKSLDEAADAVRGCGAEALTVPTDVSDREQCRRAVAWTVDHCGGLDILVCSAGVSMRAYFEGSDLDAMERVVRTNFFGTMYTTYFALPHVKSARGSLVAISSLTGKRGIPSYSIYGASKSAVQGLYESLRLELARDGVHVGVVSPGFVDTPLRDRVIGPDGRVWATPPPPPFHIWPVGRCAERVVRLILRRQDEALIPWYTKPLLVVDDVLGGRIGKRLLPRKFPPEARA